jgi:hypothetical protein
MTSLLPPLATASLGPLPAIKAGLISFGIGAIEKLTKPGVQFDYPQVYRTLMSVEDKAARAVRKLVPQ